METAANTGNGLDSSVPMQGGGLRSKTDELSSDIANVKARIQVVQAEIQKSKSEAEELVNTDVAEFEKKRAEEVQEYRNKRMEEVRRIFEKEIAPLVSDVQELSATASRLEKELLAEMVVDAMTRRQQEVATAD